MKHLSLSFALLSCTIFLSGSQETNAPAPGVKKIVLRVVNGKNGKPIRDDNPNVWLGDARFPENPETNSRGEITLDITGVQPREIRILPNWYVDCRGQGDQHGGTQVRYSLDEIINTGVVTENVCGKKWLKPTPGILVLFVRPRTLKEKREL